MRYYFLFLMWLIPARLVHADNIAVFYALDEDLRALKASPGVRELGSPATVGTRSIHRLGLGPHHVYAMKMASGSVETAMSAQALLATFRCDWAFSIGPAGSLDDSLEVGRWYRVERVVSWQSGSATSVGFQPSDRAAWDFDWDALPFETLEEQAGLHPDTYTPTMITLTSGEAFIASESERTRLRHLMEAEAVDMNSFGLAAVCADHRVPLFIWRIISDRADEEASETFRNFIASYDGHGGALLAEWIAHLPPNPDAPDTYPEIQKLLPPEDMEMMEILDSYRAPVYRNPDAP